MLESILEKANSKGLRFISDSDARAQDGAHVSAHLWDNGDDVITGLDEIFKIVLLTLLTKIIINFRKIIYDQATRYRRSLILNHQEERRAHDDHSQMLEAALSYDIERSCKLVDKHADAQLANTLLELQLL